MAIGEAVHRTIRKVEGPLIEYQCQSCGKASAVAEWKGDGDICPKCGRKYDAIVAQDAEDE